MNKRSSISAYTPSNTNPEVLKRIFVQREKLLERIVDRLSRSVTSGDKHHVLLIGPRGSGKTHLVSLATWELQKREELHAKMRIAWLGEDDSFTLLLESRGNWRKNIPMSFRLTLNQKSAGFLRKMQHCRCWLRLSKDWKAEA